MGSNYSDWEMYDQEARDFLSSASIPEIIAQGYQSTGDLRPVFVRFDKHAHTLIFSHGYVSLEVGRNPAYLCEKICTKPSKVWHADELYRALEEDEMTKQAWRTVYAAARFVNQRCNDLLGDNFIITSSKEYQINPKYLRSKRKN